MGRGERALRQARVTLGMASTSTLATTWNSAGMGHIDPKLERQQLRKEIDALMGRVDKALANKDMKAEDRINRIDDYKNQINEKKMRIQQIKQEARATAAEQIPTTPRELAPVKVPAKKAAVAKAEPSRAPWQRHAELSKTKA